MILGITGGIGSGKSTVLEYLDEKGFYIIETDKLGHDAIKKGTSAYKDICNYFGNGVLTDEGEIDRIKLGKIVFNSEKDLNMLNSFVHPEVIKIINDKIQKLKSENRLDIVIESAILFESGANALCDKVLYVFVNTDERIKRLQISRGMTVEKIKSVMENQLSEDDFKLKSDYVIDNSKDFNNTRLQIEKLLEF